MDQASFGMLRDLAEELWKCKQELETKTREFEKILGKIMKVTKQPSARPGRKGPDAGSDRDIHKDFVEQDTANDSGVECNDDVIELVTGQNDGLLIAKEPRRPRTKAQSTQKPPQADATKKKDSPFAHNATCEGLSESLPSVFVYMLRSKKQRPDAYVEKLKSYIQGILPMALVKEDITTTDSTALHSFLSDNLSMKSPPKQVWGVLNDKRAVKLHLRELITRCSTLVIKNIDNRVPDYVDKDGFIRRSCERIPQWLPKSQRTNTLTTQAAGITRVNRDKTR
ncbi:hypothetical protein ETB97_003991 [Aspergillus alliaceus]|uniref:Uncharacterized protein n=1 Tax=Petromyces alliaceus TaxID=209559 RepID=A0A8H6A3A3_PETAA|nr:hypothetical protein ETB97_003991 [Aspergillus burnettii]